MSTKYKIRDQTLARPIGRKLHFVTFAVVEWIDVFTRKMYKNVLVDSLAYCQQNKGLLLYAWCIMSNHVHLILSSKEGIKQEDIIRDLKKNTSEQLLKLIKENRQESGENWMLWVFKKAGERNSNNKNYQFWRQDYHPIELSTNKIMGQRLDYLHGIVEEPEHYLYSSARDYTGIKGMLTIEFIE